MTLESWAIKWGVHAAALADLKNQMGLITDPQPSIKPPKSEAAVQQSRRILASRNGGRMWRNNVGAVEDEHGNFIRYGLCNESKEMNAIAKSSDLIGITPVVITPQLVGTTLGVFTAEECKPEGWQYDPNDNRQVAQLAFLNLVLSLGGIAQFCSKVDL